MPDEWIEDVFKACEAAPWHRYLFLTKNIHGYEDFDIVHKNNYWYGQTWDCVKSTLTNYNYYERQFNQFLSIEPLQSDNIPFDSIKKGWFDWVIVGAETGNRKGKIIPKREWIENIVNACREAKIPVFLKKNLADAGVWGKKELIQEYPWR